MVSERDAESLCVHSSLLCPGWPALPDTNTKHKVSSQLLTSNSKKLKKKPPTHKRWRHRFHCGSFWFQMFTFCLSDGKMQKQNKDVFTPAQSLFPFLVLLSWCEYTQAKSGADQTTGLRPISWGGLASRWTLLQFASGFNTDQKQTFWSVCSPVVNLNQRRELHAFLDFTRHHCRSLS